MGSILLRFILLLLLTAVAIALLAPFLPPTPPPIPPTTTTVISKVSSPTSSQHQPQPNIMMGASTSRSRAAAGFGGQAKLVYQLQREGVLRHPQVIEVMRQVDRQNYIQDDDDFSYRDAPRGIACGQTISAPHMHGFALEEILPFLLKKQQTSPNKEALKLLDVGCGSGYVTAAMGRWVQPKTTITTTPPGQNPSSSRIVPRPGAKVHGMDIFPVLVQNTRANLLKDDADLLEGGTVTLRQGNGWEGWPDAGPFDAIHVGAAAESFPSTLANQLAVGGIMVIPIGPKGGTQYFYRVERIAHVGNIHKDFKRTKLMGVQYVPLIKEL